MLLYFFAILMELSMLKRKRWIESERHAETSDKLKEEAGACRDCHSQNQAEPHENKEQAPISTNPLAGLQIQSLVLIVSAFFTLTNMSD